MGIEYPQPRLQAQECGITPDYPELLSIRAKERFRALVPPLENRLLRTRG